MSADEKDPTHEINAMRSVADAIKSLDVESRNRVLQWAAAAFGTSTGIAPVANRTHTAPTNTAAGTGGAERGTAEFSTIADLHAAAQPSGDSDRALVVAYWFQALQGSADF